VLGKTKERLDKASEELERAGVRKRAIERQLRDVEALPESDAVKLIGHGIALDGPGEPNETK
jgi:DNA recombination protein RmuC